MVRALRLLCAWGFDELGLARIGWRAYAGNTASLRTATRVGFRMEGTSRLGMVHHGLRRDGWVASLMPVELQPVSPGSADAPAAPGAAGFLGAEDVRARDLGGLS